MHHTGQDTKEHICTVLGRTPSASHCSIHSLTEKDYCSLLASELIPRLDWMQYWFLCVHA